MATQKQSFTIHSYGRSDIGLVRDNNEDAWLAEPQSNVFVLCDGVGGHLAGEVASQEAVALFAYLVEEYFRGGAGGGIQEEINELKKLIQEVNVSIYNLAQQDRELRGMGTTMCCVYFQEKRMVVGHVGDSRVYLLRNQELAQITKDHSLVSELLDIGELNDRQAREYAYRNVITRAIGMEPDVEPSVGIHDLNLGDQILMCSDGLSDMLSLREIEGILNKETPLEETVERLIEKANRKGGSDNITTVLMKIQSGDE